MKYYENMFKWADENLVKFEVQQCDESEHYYFDGEMVGGWAGDTRQYFAKRESTGFAKIQAAYNAIQKESDDACCYE
jgi:hypothetical protein